MPLDFTTLSGDLAFLHGQLHRLLRQLLGRGIDLLRGRFDLRLLPFEARAVVGQRLPHVGDTALPFEQLLAEPGHGEAMIGTLALQG